MLGRWSQGQGGVPSNSDRQMNVDQDRGVALLLLSCVQRSGVGTDNDGHVSLLSHTGLVTAH